MSIRNTFTPGLEREPIAIIGIGCRFPGEAIDPESFWSLLTKGMDAITEIPKDRWNIDEFYHPTPGMPAKSYSRWGGFIKGIDQFDPEAFGISPREASHIDPQQRLLLEVAWEALQDGGQVIDRLAGTNTGVFIGISTYDYAQIQSSLSSKGPVDAHTATGGALSIAANRVSYCLNLHGPSIAVDTACSSSLVATDLACRSIWHGECNLALAGGVNIIIKPDPFIAFSAASMLSPDGRCKAFDTGANGFVRSEGAGIIVLKPLSRALAEGDPVYALIVGSAVNQDGRTNGIAMPSQASQEALIREVYERAGIDPGEVDYIEAHGTGTAVGDPIEAMAIGRVLSSGRPEGQYCVIGSVKTNIGHLEAGAGIAGVIKTALSLKHRMVPPNLHFLCPNPNIPFEQLKLRVPISLEPWPNGSKRAIAGVNSFGFGGTNAHLILMEYRREAGKLSSGPRSSAAAPLFFPLSARTPTALKQLVQSYQQFLESEVHGDTALTDLCYTAAVRRDHFDHRLSIVAHDSGELRERLEAFVAGETRANMFTGCRKHGSPPKIAFVFSGQGPQWWGMGRELLEHEPVFREVIQECDRLFSQYADWSLLKELSADEGSSRLQETAIAQPALFSLQVALSALWKSWGVTPDAVVGHSVGEVAAAYIAGSLSLRDAVRVIFHRGRCMELAKAKGKMLAVGLTVAEAGRAIQGCEDRVSIAAVNSPSSLTLSGNPHELEQINGLLSQRGIFSRFLRVDYAFHSAQMEPVREDLLASLAGLDDKPSTLPIISTVTGKRVKGRRFNEDYWWQNVRRMVRFAEAMDQLIQEGHDVFLEVSPHPVLAGSISECLIHRGQKGTVLSSLRRQEDQRAVMLGSLGALYALGKPLDWRKLWPRGGKCCRLPGHPWERRSYWNEPDESREDRLKGRNYPLLKRTRASANPTWKVSVDTRLFPYLEDHKVNGNTVVPAAAYIEMALEAAREILGEGVLILEGIQFRRALFLPDKDENPTVQLVYQPADGSFSIHSNGSGSEDAWTLHTVGYMRVEQDRALPAKIDIEKMRGNYPGEISSEVTYRRFSEMGLQFGPTFRGVERIWKGDGEALGRVRLCENLEPDCQRYCFQPAFLDSCFQILSAAIPMDGMEEYQALYLPVQVERVRLFASPGFRAWCHARFTNVAANALEGDLHIYDDGGDPVMEIKGFRCQSVGELADDGRDLEKWFYEIRWQKRPGPRPRSVLRRVDYVPACREIAQAVEGEVRQLAGELGWSGMHSNAYKALDRLANAYVIEAMLELDWNFKLGERVAADLLVDRLKISSNYQRLSGRFLRMLDKGGYLERAGANEWIVNQTLTKQDPQKIWLVLLSQFPSFIAELMLIDRCGRDLPRILRGELAPLQAIFPAGSTSVAEHLYQDSPTFRFYNIMVQKTVDRALKELPAGKMARILEIGGGTGGMTAYVLPKLPADRSEYVFSDISPLFFQKAEQKFHDYPFLKCQSLDIQRNPLEQDFEPHSFDIILASDVLHATRDLYQALAHIRKLLVSRGVLILLVNVKAHDWLDMVFGLTGRSWNFRDLDLRPDPPLIPRGQWKVVLSGSGFADIEDLSLATTDEEPNQIVLVARGPVVEEETENSPKEDVVQNLEGEKRAWLIFADQNGFSDKLTRLLGNRGEATIPVTPGEGYNNVNGKSFQISPGSSGDMERLLCEISESYSTAWRGAVHLWSLDSPSVEETTVDSLQRAETLGCYSVLHYVQALSKLNKEDKPPRLLLVTRNAQPVGMDHKPLSIAQTPLIGLGRVIANEFPKLRLKMVDIGPEDAADDIQSLVEEILSEEGEEEVALRQEASFVPRIERVEKERVAAAREPACQGKKPFRVEIPKAGSIERLTLRETVRHAPGPGQVEIEVFVASLNFRDVMKTLGLYPAERKEDTMLGDECAGRIVAVGEGVEDFIVGDEVVGIALGSLGSYTTAMADLVMRKPAHLTFEEAATVPVAYLTSYYSLHHLGQIKAGERVLIHSAAGGVGLAGIAIARCAGAELFATAGTPEKRELLKLLGVQHVMDSRSLLFSDQILEITGGRGVDVILNSLAGKAIAKGLLCLAPFGRFLELGKRDIYEDSRLGLWPFRKNVSFFAIDLGRLMADKPALVRTLVGELSQHIHRGDFRPLPYRVFPISRVKDAFRYMAQGKHMGKIVLSMRGEDPIPVPMEDTSVAFRPDGTYLITGGLGGFGLTVARWIIDNGGRNLVLLSRSGAESEEAKTAVGDLRKLGAEVVVAKADIANEAQLAEVLDEIDRTMPPLKGVFHAAMVLDDGILFQLNQQRFRKVTAPKVDGTWNLHAQTLNRPLDYFVLFSSVSSLIGNRGQGNYAAANAFLDAFAHYRRSQGLPAVTINWGHLAEVGYAARQRRSSDHLIQLGVVGFSPKQAMEALARILRRQPIQEGVIRADWKRLSKFVSKARLNQRFSSLMGEHLDQECSGEEKAHIREVLSAAKPEERQEIVQRYIREQVAIVLRTSAAKLDTQQPLNQMGLDSLMAVELTNRIEGDLRLSLPAGRLVQGPSIESLSMLALDLLAPPDSTPPTPPIARQAGEARATPVVDLDGEAVLDPSICSEPLAAGSITEPAHLFLTGSTGFLGAFLLHELLQQTQAKICCLVRASNAEEGKERIQENLEYYSLAVEGSSSRIFPVMGDLARPLLGMSPDQFQQLAGNIDAIYHNGALVNFLHPYSALKPTNVQGTQEVLRLASQIRPKQVHYISTLSVFTLVGNSEIKVIREDDILVPDANLFGAYAQSKWVAEKIVTIARSRGLPVSIYRPGMIFGDSRTGISNQNDFLEWLLKICISLGQAPDLDMVVDMAPVDFVSQAIIYLSKQEKSIGKTFHLVNPEKVHVKQIIEWMRVYGYRVQQVPYQSWKAALLNLAEEYPQDTWAPFLDLIRAVETDQVLVPRFECQNALAGLAGSPIICPPVGPELLGSYLSYFIRRGFVKAPLAPGDADSVHSIQNTYNT